MSRWEGKDMLHSVESGETLHFIAQLYGVRVKSLAKLNRLKVDATLQTGQTLKLR
jgi:LysM repeat protein